MRCLWRILIALTMALGLNAPAASTTTYYHNDLTGSPLVATDGNGHVLWRESYRPYGERLVNSASAKGNDVWFTSRRQDAETGLVYMGARYYDPVAGRFASIDPHPFTEVATLSFNKYAYANDNPYRNTDSDGKQALPALTPPPIVPTDVRPVLEGRLGETQLVKQLEGYTVGPPSSSLALPGKTATELGARILGGYLGLDAWAAASNLIFSISGSAGQRGKAPEFAGGHVSESGFVEAAIRFLGAGAIEASSGRYKSADGLRQVRFGAHETRSGDMHAHFEAYDKAGGRVIENTSVKVNPD